ncbi:MAG: hypothetical protein AAFU79_36225 [Myxococcota bacterium]
MKSRLLAFPVGAALLAVALVVYDAGLLSILESPRYLLEDLERLAQKVEALEGRVADLEVPQVADDGSLRELRRLLARLQSRVDRLSGPASAPTPPPVDTESPPSPAERAAANRAQVHDRIAEYLATQPYETPEPEREGAIRESLAALDLPDGVVLPEVRDLSCAGSACRLEVEGSEARAAEFIPFALPAGASAYFEPVDDADPEAGTNIYVFVELDEAR